jgi:iron-sulfur cluster repair protein YtfE (RIC family)
MVWAMISITRALSAEHQMFNAVFDYFEELLPGLERLEEVRRLARLVEGMLLSHAKVEEDMLAMAQLHAREDQTRYAQCSHQHQEIDSRLTRIQSAREIVRARTLLREALAASRKHFKHEERKVFPLVEKGVNSAALTKLGTVWLLRRYALPRWTV